MPKGPRRAFVGVLFLFFLTSAASRNALAQLESPNPQPTDNVDVITIRLTRFGAYPASVTHKHGPFVLLISNRSGTLDDTYSLTRKLPAGANPAASDSLLDFHSDHTAQRDHQLIKLSPGDYVLRVKSHPDWTVDIKITTEN